jgi:uncharacterized phage-like protein YoqJ
VENYFSKKFTIDKNKILLTQKNQHHFKVIFTSKKESDLTFNTAFTCCFTGHRDLPQNSVTEIYANLVHTLKILYENYRVKTFISGGAIGFDLLAAEAVLELKRSYPDAKLIFALPCIDHTKKWGDAAVTKFRLLSLCADQTVYVSQHYYTGCMQVRNKYMLEHSQFCIVYCKKTSGGSYYTLREAKKMNLNVIEL